MKRWMRGLRPGWLVLGLATGIACLDTSISPVGPGVRAEDAIGLWVLHVTGETFGNHIQLLRVDAAEESEWPLRLTAIDVQGWNGAPAHDLKSTLARGRLVEDVVEWELVLVSGGDALMKWRVFGDTVRGTLRLTDGTSGGDSLVGVRVSASLISQVAAPYAAVSSWDSTPQVLIRVDDIPPSDRDFIRRLRDRGLVAELAVPTLWVGRYGRPSWSELRAWALAGFGVAAHSRTHSASPSGDLRFMSEVLGSIGDLRSHGLPTYVFVQPGTWADSLNFNSSTKLRNWRGTLLRSFTRVFEGYVYAAPVSQPAADSIALGVSHVTISDGVNAGYVLDVWKRAAQPNRFTVFLVHTRNLPSPDAVDWFLDTLATARTGGRIRIVSSSAEVLRER